MLEELKISIFELILGHVPGLSGVEKQADLSVWRWVRCRVVIITAVRSDFDILPLLSLLDRRLNGRVKILFAASLAILDFPIPEL